MVIPCNRPHGPASLDLAYIANRIGLDERVIGKRLHKLKQAWGLRGSDKVTICLDNGLVYVSASEEKIGDLNDP
jgi:hypothetical protein